MKTYNWKCRHQNNITNLTLCDKKWTITLLFSNIDTTTFFLIDVSSSLFQVLTFIETLTSRISGLDELSQFALVTYSTVTDILITLGDYNTTGRSPRQISW